jgi:hypothetical protein
MVMFTVFRECLSVSRLKKVRHAGESRHPGAGNRETTGKLDSGVRRMTKEEIEFESMVLEPTRFGYDVGTSLNITKRARRFFTRHSSVCSKQAGASLP